MNPYGIVLSRSEWLKRELAWRLRRNMTPSERCLWQHIRGIREGNPHFRRQQIIEGFIADFYSHPARLAVEVDGTSHDATGEYDAERERIFSDLGIQTIRCSNSRIMSNVYTVAAEIFNLAKQRITHGL